MIFRVEANLPQRPPAVVLVRVPAVVVDDLGNAQTIAHRHGGMRPPPAKPHNQQKLLKERRCTHMHHVAYKYRAASMVLTQVEVPGHLVPEGTQLVSNGPGELDTHHGETQILAALSTWSTSEDTRTIASCPANYGWLASNTKRTRSMVATHLQHNVCRQIMQMKRCATARTSHSNSPQRPGTRHTCRREP